MEPAIILIAGGVLFIGFVFALPRYSQDKRQCLPFQAMVAKLYQFTIARVQRSDDCLRVVVVSDDHYTENQVQATTTVILQRSFTSSTRMTNTHEASESTQYMNVKQEILGSTAENCKASLGEVQCGYLTYGTAEDIGPKRAMEDKYFVLGEFSSSGSRTEAIKVLAGVFDGHNGVGAAEFSARNFVEFMKVEKSDSVPEALAGCLKRCEDELYKVEGEVGGTTALVAAVAHERVYIANVGDCRAVLSQDGKAVQVTEDHKPANEKRRILAAGGFLDSEEYLNGEIGVSRSIGDFNLIENGVKKMDGSGPLVAEPQMHTQELSPRCEFLILASDGVWDVISNQRAVDIVHRLLVNGAQPQDAAQKIVEESKVMESRDNATAIVLALRTLPLPPRKAPPRKFKNSRLRLAPRCESSKGSSIHSESPTRPVGV